MEVRADRGLRRRAAAAGGRQLGRHVHAARPRRDLKPLEIVQPEGPSFDGRRPRGPLAEVAVPHRLHARARAWSCTPSATRRRPRPARPLPGVDLRDGRPLRRPGRAVLTARTPSTSASTASARWPTRWPWAATASGTIRYFDAHLTDSRGEVVTIKNAVCLHEEDDGILWKHTDWRTNQAEVRRSRRLAVSFIATVGNYEYGFYWYFYQDGSIQLRGEADRHHEHDRPAARARRRPTARRSRPRLQRAVPPALLRGPARHGIDGETNSVYEVNTRQPAARARTTRTATPSAPRRRCWRPRTAARRTRQRGHGAVLADRQPGREEPPGPSRSPTGSCPARTARRSCQPEAAVLKRAGFTGAPSVGDAVRPGRAVPGRRLPEPEPRRRRACHAGPTADRAGRGHRRGRLVHLRRTRTCRGRRTGR